ncbi:MAG TPA: pyridoxal phosphate-dependent aminotransferase [Steroidobacteraceae bacterium]|jgi:aspartate/methionine/tyrosine aminotransferase
MKYKRMPIEVESPEEIGYSRIRYNLSESSVSDRKISDLNLVLPDLTLLYGEHRGSKTLRTLIASERPTLAADDVLITGGAAGALFIIATALLRPKDHLVVVRPNYATNLETPRAIGCAISHIDLSFESGFRMDLEKLAAAVTPETKLISITSPHNPTGVAYSESDLRFLVQLARSRGCYLLVDETYRDLSYGEAPPLAASLAPHVISVSSLSKAFGMPGLRVGWLITQDSHLKELFLAAKEQISICGSVIDEWVAEQVLTRKGSFLDPIKGEMHRRRRMVAEWIAGEELLEWVPPDGGVVCFPRMRRNPAGGTDRFYEELMSTHGAYVGPGHWFEMPDTFFRLGYGWPTSAELQEGLRAISTALRA